MKHLALSPSTNRRKVASNQPKIAPLRNRFPQLFFFFRWILVITEFHHPHMRWPHPPLIRFFWVVHLIGGW
jgi:hypothetical protein